MINVQGEDKDRLLVFMLVSASHLEDRLTPASPHPGNSTHQTEPRRCHTTGLQCESVNDGWASPSVGTVSQTKSRWEAKRSL